MIYINYSYSLVTGNKKISTYLPYYAVMSGYRKKEAALPVQPLFSFLIVVLSWMNCLNGTNVCAGATIGAYISIDFINITF
jgi:hypothetical protein